MFLVRYIVALSALSALSLAGCVAYSPAPIDLRANQQALAARSLDEVAIQDRLIQVGALSAAQAFPLQQWNRAQLLVAATTHNAQLNQARQQWRVAQAAVKTARAVPNPAVSLGSEYSLSQSSESPWLWSVTLDWLWDAGARRYDRVSLANVQLQSARLGYAEALWQLRSELRGAELSWLMALQRQRMLDELVATQQRLLALLQQQRQLGALSELDLLPVQQELARWQAQQTQNRTKYQTAHSQLANLLGVPQSALADKVVEWNDVTQIAKVDKSELTKWREQALLSRSDLEQAVLDYQAKEIELKQQVRAQYPQLSVGPGFTWDHGVKKATLGLSFNLPLFNRNQGPIAEALVQRDAAGEQVMAVQAGILTDIDAAWAVWQQSVAAVETQLAQADAAESAYARTQQAKQLGATDEAAVLSVQVLSQTQQLAVLDQVEVMQQALGKLEDALRRPLTGPEQQLNRTQLAQP
jgi:outer membrane protein, heavy metal efflux system